MFSIHRIFYKSMYLNYTFPLEPRDKTYIKNTVISLKNHKRSKYLTKNTTRGKE